MKRHEALQPFSRDHNVGLVIARKLSQQPSAEAVEELLAIWRDEMRDHFQEEERLLIPLSSPEQAERMVTDHRQIEAMIRQAQETGLESGEIREVGEILADHIRWEERVLFPALESQKAMQRIAGETALLEKRREQSPHSPRRASLMHKKQKD